MIRLVILLCWLVLAALVIPSVAFLFTIGFDAMTDCELNPYNGFTCPAWMAPFVALSVFGILTIFPAVILGIIVLVIWWDKRFAQQ